jgi:hypothetical protein
MKEFVGVHICADDEQLSMFSDLSNMLCINMQFITACATERQHISM